MLRKYDIINKLNYAKVKYELHEHEALFTVKDSREKRGIIKGAHTKNLLLKDKKDQFVLFSCLEEDHINIKLLSGSIGYKNLSFAKENILNELMGVLPGSVSPFALLNDKNNKSNFFLEENVYTSEFLNFHPLINTSTITLKTIDFIKFMIENKKKIHIFSIEKKIVLKTYE
jgi:Ala-tRNA(Pro) deacylase